MQPQAAKLKLRWPETRRGARNGYLPFTNETNRCGSQIAQGFHSRFPGGCSRPGIADWLWCSDERAGRDGVRFSARNAPHTQTVPVGVRSPPVEPSSYCRASLAAESSGRAALCTRALGAPNSAERRGAAALSRARHPGKPGNRTEGGGPSEVLNQTNAKKSKHLSNLAARNALSHRRVGSWNDRLASPLLVQSLSARRQVTQKHMPRTVMPAWFLGLRPCAGFFTERRGLASVCVRAAGHLALV